MVAAEPGFEPELRDPKSLVLPLHYSAMGGGLVPRAGLEPARACGPMVFETIASTIPPPRHATFRLSGLANGVVAGVVAGVAVPAVGLDWVQLAEADQTDAAVVRLGHRPAVAVQVD